MNTIRLLLAITVLSLTAASGWAQSTPPPSLGSDIKAIIDNKRGAMKALVDARKALILQMQNATPAERDAIRAQLQETMKATAQSQRDLARAIRAEIQARRNQGPGGS
jgi:uncharacterized membrane protein